MIILLDTSTGLCQLSLVDGEMKYDYEWQADRTLAHGLLGYIKQKLQDNNRDFIDLTGIGVFAGPGSFTGIRIGLTVANTLADSLAIPIVGSTDSNWQSELIKGIRDGRDDRIVMPFYGSDANITKPRK